MKTIDGRVLTVDKGQDTATLKAVNDAGKPRAVLTVPYGVVPELAAALIQRKVGRATVAAVDDGRPIEVEWLVGPEDGQGNTCRVFVGKRNVLKVDASAAHEVGMALHHAASGDPDSNVGQAEPEPATVDTAAPVRGVPVERQRETGSSAGDLVSLTLSELDLDEAEMFVYREPRSWTQLTKFEECGWCYYRRYRRRVREQPSWWLVGGRAMHSFIEEFELARADHELPTSVDTWAPGAFITHLAREVAAEETEQAEQFKLGRDAWPDRSTWRAAKRGSEGEAFWYSEGVAMARRYAAENTGERPWEPLRLAGGDGAPDQLGLELELEGTFGGVSVRGFIDRVVVTKDGLVWIDDYKSGASTPSDNGQLILYCALVAQSFPELRVAGARHLKTRTGQFYETRVDGRLSELVRPIDYRFERFDFAEREEIYLPNLNGYGHRCSFYEDVA